MKQEFTNDHRPVQIREHFGRYLARFSPAHYRKQGDGQDAILVDYFTGIAKNELPDVIRQTEHALSLAHFPGGKAEVVYRDGDPFLRFEGRELLEMLVQFGARFEGWDAYKNESTLLSRPFR